MNRPIHFELHADDLERAKDFYAKVFGWGYEDYSEVAGEPYWGVVTGPDEVPGINGAMMQRKAPLIEDNPVSAAVITIQVADYNHTDLAIAEAGGFVAVAKHAIPGMAWQGYYRDPEGNLFGIHQADPEAN